MGLLRDRTPAPGAKGEWRLNLRQERVRRVRDARDQPRIEHGYWSHVPRPRPRRVALDSASREQSEEREWELRQEEQALAAELRHLRNLKASDRLDQGRRVSVREMERHHAKRYTASGGRTAVAADRYTGNQEALTRAADRRREIAADLARVKAERARVKDSLVYGDFPRNTSGAWRTRLGR